MKSDRIISLNELHPKNLQEQVKKLFIFCCRNI